jgi:hypothetical protein
MTANTQFDFFVNQLEEDLKKLVEDHPHIGTIDKAFGPWSLMLLTGAPVNEAIDSLVDGGGDKGLDIICLPSDPGTLVVLQAKHFRNMNNRLDRSEIAVTLNGVRWLLKGDLSEPTINSGFRAQAAAFRQAFTADFPKVEIYLVCTGQGPGPEGQAEIDMFLQEFNPGQENVFSVFYVDADELFARYRRERQKTTPNEITLEFSKPNPYEHDIGPMRALVGSVAGCTLAELFDQHGNTLFEANVRNYLGNVRINQEIERTATDPDQAERFWFYNNGISIVCSQYSFRSHLETSKVRLVNAQIVNGCQTVHSLWHALRSGKLQGKAEVIVRIIEQPDPDFVPLVTRYNNSQNAVRSADLVGRELIQVALQKDMEKLGYYYETRRGDWKQYYSDRDECIAKFGKDYAQHVIRLKEAAQASAAFYLQQPVTAKSKTALLTTSMREDGIYEEVFDATISAQKIVGAVGLMRKITERRKEIVSTGKPVNLAEQADWLPHADYFILALFARQYFDPNNITTNDQVERFFQEVDTQFDLLFSKIVRRMGNIIARHKKEPGYNHPKFFKSEAGWKEISKAMGEPSPIKL